MLIIAPDSPFSNDVKNYQLPFSNEKMFKNFFFSNENVSREEFDKAIKIYMLLGEMEEVTKTRKLKIRRREELLDYDSAIHMWEELGENEEAARVRKLKADLAAPKTEIHGDYVDDRDTIVKDSVINRSSIGAGGDDKFARLEKLTEMKEKGLIDDDEFQQMKKEILGK